MSNTKAPKSIRAHIIRHLREWHRRLGIWAAFFLIFLSVTGIALNHTNFLGLAHQPITNTWLLNQYGIKNPVEISGYHQGKLIVTDQYVWLKGQLLTESSQQVIAAEKIQQFWFILSENQLSLFNNEGELVDQLDKSLGLPEDISHIALLSEQFMVKTPSGYFQADENLTTWQPVSTIIEPQWVTKGELTPDEKEKAKLLYRSQFLTLERIVVDAHSGRIFGDLGVFFMDLAALCLILISVSGIYIWMRYKKSRR